MGSVWPGEDPNERFYGVITKRMRYKGRKGESVNGYEVLWDDGGKERWPYEYLVMALVPEEEDLLESVSDTEDSESDMSEVEEKDVFDIMTEREDPEDFEYQEMFSTSHTGEDIVVPDECS